MKKVLLGIAVAFILMIGGCVALIGGTLNAADEAIKKEEANNAPTTVIVGKAFTHDDWTVGAGWKLRKDVIGSTELVGKVTNQAKSARSALLTFKVLQGNQVLADITCSTDELEAGQATQLDCLSGDDFPKAYEKVTVEDSF